MYKRHEWLAERIRPTTHPVRPWPPTTHPAGPWIVGGERKSKFGCRVPRPGNISSIACISIITIPWNSPIMQLQVVADIFEILINCPVQPPTYSECGPITNILTVTPPNQFLILHISEMVIIPTPIGIWFNHYSPCVLVESLMHNIFIEWQQIRCLLTRYIKWIALSG